MTQGIKKPAGQSGGKLEVQSGGVLDIESGGALQVAGVDKTAILNAAVAGVAAGYKVARGVAADVTAAEEITSGLATVVAATACLAGDPVVGEAMWVTVSIPAQVGGDAGKFTVKTWKPTANDNATPTAGTGDHDVAWIAVGT